MNALTGVPLLETIALCRNFGGLKAVRDVSMSLALGELHAVIGPNGAGKSTLVNLLSGDVTPSSGTIQLAGADISRAPSHRRPHLGIARSFQRTNIFKPLTAFENVRLAAQAVTPRPSRWTGTRAHHATLAELANACLKRVGLTPASNQIAGTLSHGAQRQLEIAMSLAASPKVLLLDEPLAGMGQEEGERMATLLKSLAQDHAVLLIEHDMDFVFKVADRMTVMVEGTVLASGAPADVRNIAAVQAAYLGTHAPAGVHA
jgi:branched-chain amino acid transport system ATP-binding protein